VTVTKKGANIFLAGRVLCLTVVFALAPSLSQGDGGQFTPTLLGLRGDLELGMTQAENDNTNNGAGLRTSETVFRESLRLSATGYVYHPRFILFTLGGAGGVEQQTFDRSFTGTSRSVRSLEEYDVRARVLPEHPYNLELFALRLRPVTRNRYTPDVRSTTDERGVVFRYTQKPLFLDLSAIDISTAGTTSSDATTYRAAGSYTAGPASTSGGYSRTGATAFPDEHTVKNTYFIMNHLDLKPVFLTSRIDGSGQRQEALFSPSLDAKTFSWTEQLQAELPFRFSAAASCGIQRNEVTASGLAADGESTNETDSFGLVLSHRLYESLTTEYGMTATSMESTGGSVDTRNQYLFANYSKKVPTGRLTANISLRRTVSQKAGAPVILQESHTASISGDFTLNAQSVNEATLAVWVKDPATGSLIPLALSTHYAVQTVGETVRVVIIALPAPFLPATPYEFLASYAVLPARGELETWGESYTLRASLFENLVAPYYSHAVMTQKVLSGAFPGEPDASATDTAGVAVQKGPASLTTQYSDTRSRISPAQSWKTTLEYREGVEPTMDLFANLTRERNTYRASAAYPESRNYTEEITVTGLSAQKRFPRADLNLTAGMSYSRRNSFIDSDAYALNAMLLWRLGKLTVALGSSANRAASHTQNGRQEASSEYHYLTVTRKLF
jgi:hypothetical protein